jgi:hypothetical protein
MTEPRQQIEFNSSAFPSEYRVANNATGSVANLQLRCMEASEDQRKLQGSRSTAAARSVGPFMLWTVRHPGEFVVGRGQAPDLAGHPCPFSHDGPVMFGASRPPRVWRVVVITWHPPILRASSSFDTPRAA